MDDLFKTRAGECGCDDETSLSVTNPLFRTNSDIGCCSSSSSGGGSGIDDNVTSMLTTWSSVKIVQELLALSGDYVPLARTLTINGATLDLSADRSWSVGTVTSIGITPGTGISVSGSPVTGSGNITVVNTAPDQVVALSAGYGIGITGTYPNFTVASTLTGDYITSLTGEATAVGPGAASVTLLNAAVIGKVLTGLNVTGGTVVATDSILTAFGKVQNQITSLLGGVTFQTVWNATTNSPALASGVGTKGHYYVVNVAGSTSLDGITDWKVGDWAIYDGTAWQKVDNTDAVSSVNTFVGAVSLTTFDVPEVTNLYYTDARARAAISLTTTGTSGAATYDSGTGVFNIPQYADASGGSGYIQNQVASTQTAGFKISGDGTLANLTASTKVNVGSPSGTSGALNTGQDGVYSYRSGDATRFIRFNASGTFNDFLSLGAKLVMNYGFSGTVQNISMFEGSGAGDGQFIVGSPTATNARFLLKGKDTGTTNYISRWFDSGNTEKFSVRNDGQTTVASLSAGGIVKSTAGVLSIATAGTDYLTPGGLSATSPIFYNSGTGVISSQAASHAVEGYVTTGSQYFAGIKSFVSGEVNIGSTTSYAVLGIGRSSSTYGATIVFGSGYTLGSSVSQQWGLGMYGGTTDFHIGRNPSAPDLVISNSDGSVTLTAPNFLHTSTGSTVFHEIRNTTSSGLVTYNLQNDGSIFGNLAIYGSTYTTSGYNEANCVSLYSSTRLHLAADGNTSAGGIRLWTGSASVLRYEITYDGNHDFKSGTATFGGALTGTSATFNLSKLRLSGDGTYGTNYSTIGFGGTSSNGDNRIFAGNDNGDHLYLAGGTGKGVKIWANGSSSDIATFLNNSITFTQALTGTSATFSGGMVAATGEINNFNGAAAYGLNINSTSDTGTQYMVEFLRIGTQAGYIASTSSTTVGIFNTSDYRTKDDLRTFSGVELVKAMNFYDFKWKDSGIRDYGVIAHELQGVLPNSVIGKKDGERNQAVDYVKLVPIYGKALQEALIRIEELERRLNIN